MDTSIPEFPPRPRPTLEAVLSTALELEKIPLSISNKKLAEGLMKAVGNRPVNEVLLAIKLRKIAEVLLDE